MASSRTRKRENHAPGALVYPPADRDQWSAQDDHTRNYGPRNGERKPKLLQDLWDFLEEITLLHFLDSGSPSDVQRKHMGENGNTEGNGEPSEEEKEERNPLDVLQERPEEFLVSQSVFQKSVRDRAGPKEDDRGGQPDLETVHVEVVDGKLES